MVGLRIVERVAMSCLTMTQLGPHLEELANLRWQDTPTLAISLRGFEGEDADGPEVKKWNSCSS